MSPDVHEGHLEFVPLPTLAITFREAQKISAPCMLQAAGALTAAVLFCYILQIPVSVYVCCHQFRGPLVYRRVVTVEHRAALEIVDGDRVVGETGGYRAKTPTVWECGVYACT